MSARWTIVALVLGIAACAGDAAPVTEADYRADLESICAATAATIDALPRPPEQISVADFATSAANALDAEAERVRALDVPDSLDDDHRAFVLNTDQQAATWRSIAAAADDQLGQLTVRVGELIRGRNDLVDDMGVAPCRRGEV